MGHALVPSRSWRRTHEPFHAGLAWETMDTTMDLSLKVMSRLMAN
jgi:hypothetical protein